MRRYALRDDQWERIGDFLPGREGHVGGTAADNRLFVEAVLFRYRTGNPWRDLPERFGDSAKPCNSHFQQHAMKSITWRGLWIRTSAVRVHPAVPSRNLMGLQEIEWMILGRRRRCTARL